MNTTTTARRRPVRYQTFDEVLAEAEAAAATGAATTGNWSLGQIFEHIAIALERSIDGFEFTVGWPLRLLGRYVIKQRMLLRGMPAGIRLKGSAMKELVPPETSMEAGLAHLRRAIARFQSETRRAAHPVFGPMTPDESTRMQLRHAELHMSFIALESGAQGPSQG
jgi:hypothetical protein